MLRQIREHNPILFDFVLKRSLWLDGRAFPASVFETRGFFQNAGWENVLSSSHVTYFPHFSVMISVPFSADVRWREGRRTPFYR